MMECGVIITDWLKAVSVDLACRWRKTLLWKMQTKKQLLFGLENAGFSNYRHIFVNNSKFRVEQSVTMTYNI